MWESPNVAGQTSLPFDTQCSDEVLCAVTPGQAPAIVAAYERAARLAEQLWDALDRAGLGWEVIQVVPSLTDDLRPVVRVQLTAQGARQAGWLFGGGPGPPSRQDGDGPRVA